MDLNDLAKLAGVPLKESQKMGPEGQAKGKDTMPKAEPGRTKHPLKDKLVGEAPQGFAAGFKGYNKIDPWLGGSDEKKSKEPAEKPKPAEKPGEKPGEKPDPKPQGGEKPQPTPNPWPTSAEGYTLKVGDLVTYANKKGQTRKDIPVVDLLYKQKDEKGRPQIQLELRGATYAISRDQIQAVNGKKFTLNDAETGQGKIESIKDRLYAALEANKG